MNFGDKLKNVLVMLGFEPAFRSTYLKVYLLVECSRITAKYLPGLVSLCSDPSCAIKTKDTGCFAPLMSTAVQFDMSAKDWLLAYSVLLASKSITVDVYGCSSPASTSLELTTKVRYAGVGSSFFSLLQEMEAKHSRMKMYFFMVRIFLTKIMP